MEKVIYTRCSPWIDLNQNGKITYSEGYGVSCISQDFFKGTEGVNYRLLVKCLEEEKCDPNDYNKLFEYVAIGNDKYILNAVSALPLCKEPRRNGRTHRPIFMSEAIVGVFNDKPARYLTKDNFLGDQTSQNDYYHLDVSNTEQPRVLEQAIEANLIKQGVTDGFLTPTRQDVLAKILAYVLEQNGLPENKKTVLYIKDTNENVINYVRALNDCLPVAIARKVTFLTHTTSFKNNPERYAYYVLGSTGLVSEYNSFSAELKPNRRIKYMIIGYTNGLLNKNMNSEFNSIDGVTGQCTFTPMKSSFVFDIAHEIPAAKEFLNYIEQSLGGKLGGDIDSLYQTFKSINSFSPNCRHDECCSLLENFLNSPFASNEDDKNRIINNVLGVYPRMAFEDANSNFRLIGLAKRLNMDFASKLLTIAYQNIVKGFDESPVSEQAVRAYDVLRKSPYGSEATEKDLITKHVKGERLTMMTNSSEQTLASYFSLYLKLLDYNGKFSIKGEEGNILLSFISRYVRGRGQLFTLADNYLKDKLEAREAIYKQAITNSLKANDTALTDALFENYKPGLKFADRLVEEIKISEKSQSFSYYEDLLISNLEKNPSRANEYGEALITLLCDVYKEELDKPVSGMRFANKLIYMIKSSGGKELSNATHYLYSLLTKKTAADNGEFEKFKKILGEKSVNYALNYPNDVPDSKELKALGVSLLDALQTLKSKVLASKSGLEQIKAFEEFAPNAFAITPDTLATPFMKEIIAKLNYNNVPIHLHFFNCFYNLDQTTRYLSIYFRSFFENKEFDGIMFYYSLALCLVEENKTSNVDKMIKSLNALLATEDNEIIKECFDKKWTKTIENYPKQDAKQQKALQILNDHFTTYDKAHKGFFAKLFGGKK